MLIHMVKAVIPIQYGFFHAENGKEYRGGDVADLSANEMRAYALKPATPDDVKDAKREVARLEADKKAAADAYAPQSTSASDTTDASESDAPATGQ